MAESECYHYNVGFYKNVPSGISSIPEMIELGTERLLLYKILEENSDVTIADLKKGLKGTHLLPLLETDELEAVIKARKEDTISYLILKTAYTNNNSFVFIRNEARWFNIRFAQMPIETRKKFLGHLNLNKKFFNGQMYYKVRWETVSDLVRKRQCQPKLGFVILPEQKIHHYVIDRFKNQMNEEFKEMRKKEVPEQLKVVTDFLNLVGPKEYQTDGTMSLSELDHNANFFPLCMKNQYEQLRIRHHLHYPSRQEFGFFLKDCGLNFEDALELWKSEFTKLQSEEEFNKKYLYYFKHQYGLVGNRMNYPAFSCSTMLGRTTKDQCNGCPFKTWDLDKLTERMTEDSIDIWKQETIFELIENENFTKACTCYFETLYHPLEETVSHPNLYFKQAGAIDIEDLCKSDDDDNFF